MRIESLRNHRISVVNEDIKVIFEDLETVRQPVQCFDVRPVLEATPAVSVEVWILFFKDINATVFLISYSSIDIANIIEAILKD